MKTIIRIHQASDKKNYTNTFVSNGNTWFHITKLFGKGMNSTILPLAMCK